MEPLVVRTARGRIEVADSGGDGPALLVVHGLPGSWQQAQSLVRDLPDARVLLVSRPGYGRTPLSSGRTAADHGDLYAALLDTLGIASAVALGISAGGPSAYAFAARHPDRCTGLVLACPVNAAVIPLDEGMRRLAAVPGVWRALALLARQVARVRPPAADPARDATPVERELLADDPVLRADAEDFLRRTPTWLSGAGMRNDVRVLLRRVVDPWPGAEVPVVVLHGDADEVVPIDSAHAYLELVPHATLTVLDGYGHAVPLFARAELIQALQGVLHR